MNNFRHVKRHKNTVAEKLEGNTEGEKRKRSSMVLVDGQHNGVYITNFRLLISHQRPVFSRLPLLRQRYWLIDWRCTSRKSELNTTFHHLLPNIASVLQHNTKSFLKCFSADEVPLLIFVSSPSLWPHRGWSQPFFFLSSPHLPLGLTFSLLPSASPFTITFLIEW